VTVLQTVDHESQSQTEKELREPDPGMDLKMDLFTQFASDLAEITKAWPSLPKAFRDAILGIIRGATGK